MCNEYLFILFLIIHVKGDLIEIEIETEYDNICQKPKLYSITDAIANLMGSAIDGIKTPGNTPADSDKNFYCFPYEDKPSFYVVPEVLKLRINPDLDKYGGFYALDQEFDKTMCTNRKLDYSYWYLCLLFAELKHEGFICSK